MPKVSVIIPTYNPGPFLREAVRSVHGQTFDDWELVVVDDASSVDTSWVEREFPRARLIRQARGGVSVGRNNGILNTAGELIAFMDHDDLWRPNKLAHQVSAMAAHPTAAIAYCDLAVIDERGEPMATAEHPAAASPATGAEPACRVELDGSVPAKPGERSNTHRAVQYFSTHFVTPSCVMVRRSTLATSGLLDPFIPFSGDYDMIIKLGSRHPVVHVAAVDTLYRKHSSNFSDQYAVGRAELSALIERYEAYARSQGDRDLLRDARRLFGRPRRLFSAQAYDCARRSLRCRDYRQTAYHLARAVWLSPAFVLGSAGQWATGQLLRPKPPTATATKLAGE